MSHRVPVVGSSLQYLTALAVVTVVTACSMAASARAQSEACGRAGRPWVSLVFVGDGFTTEWRRTVAADLRAGLRLRGIDVCVLGADGTEPPLALVRIGSAEHQQVSVSIDVHDAVTEKRVLRDVDLRRVTADGTGLTVAQAAEELLRASWAELALQDAPPPAVAPPPEVTAAVMPSGPSGPSALAPSEYEIGALFAVEHHGGGATLIGGDAFFAAWLAPRVGVEAAVGLRDGTRASGARGSVDASSLVGRMEMVFALAPRHGRYDLLAKVGTSVQRVRFTGRPDGAAIGLQQDALAMTARASLGARAAVTSAMRVCVELASGLPLASATATEAGRDLTGTSGVELHAALGASVQF